MSTYPASVTLGAILIRLPQELWSPHPMLNIQTAYRHGLANQLWPKSEAVRLALQVNRERGLSHGNGNRAMRTRVSKLPLALIRFGDQNTVQVCAWHGDSAKRYAERWATYNGHAVSHGICLCCRAKQFSAPIVAARNQPQGMRE